MTCGVACRKTAHAEHSRKSRRKSFRKAGALSNKIQMIEVDDIFRNINHRQILASFVRTAEGQTPLGSAGTSLKIRQIHVPSSSDWPWRIDRLRRRLMRDTSNKNGFAVYVQLLQTLWKSSSKSLFGVICNFVKFMHKRGVRMLRGTRQSTGIVANFDENPLHGQTYQVWMGLPKNSLNPKFDKRRIR